VSNFGLDFGPDDGDAVPPASFEDVPTQGSDSSLQRRSTGSRRAEPTGRGRGRSCLVLIVVLAMVVVALFFGGSWALNKIKSLTGSKPDYSSTSIVIDPAHAVLIQVHPGDTSADIGRTLQAAGVVESVGAFTDAAANDDRSLGIEVGYYQLNTKMKATAALQILVDHNNLVKNTVTIPEGFRVKDIVKRIIAKTDFTKSAVEAAINHPEDLGLPPEANGKLEGYLFPATYTVLPGATPKSLLIQMVDKTKQVESDLNISTKARALGYSVNQIMTIASILQYEASRNQDYPKVAEAIFNRLKIGMRLQSDATVAYANNLSGTVYTTNAQRANPSLYNTYVHAGLPPGPIGSPGETTIKAALNPVKGPWLYWVVVNLRTGETRFATTYAEHQQNVALLHQYCQTSSAC
jgi:UPF0755 protein